jgi:hypothetical protein
MHPVFALILMVAMIWLLIRLLSNLSPADIYGPVNPAIPCPHCQQTNCVRTQRQTVKTGISGAKATGAVLTGGMSVLATGLSKKQPVIKAHCDSCQMDWTIS